MYTLKIITSSVRPGRKGPLIADWIVEEAKKNGYFDVELIEMGVLNLPLMDEPNHPSMKKYVHEHTKQWSNTIDAADAFIFITAEYDYTYPAPLRNALEYLYQEWGFKAAGVVSYGGISAGTRAANNLKADLTAFKIVPIVESVYLPFYNKHINEAGEFIPTEENTKAAVTMLHQLVRWTKGLKLIKEDV